MVGIGHAAGYKLTITAAKALAASAEAYDQNSRRSLVLAAQITSRYNCLADVIFHHCAGARLNCFDNVMVTCTATYLPSAIPQPGVRLDLSCAWQGRSHS